MRANVEALLKHGKDQLIIGLNLSNDKLDYRNTARFDLFVRDTRTTNL